MKYLRTYFLRHRVPLQTISSGSWIFFFFSFVEKVSKEGYLNLDD